MRNTFRTLMTSLILVATISGCEFMQHAREVGLTPDPTTGSVPVTDIVTNIPRVVLNPFDYVGWSNLVTAIATTLAGAYGYKKWSARKSG